jgi:hypothetical protein
MEAFNVGIFCISFRSLEIFRAAQKFFEIYHSKGAPKLYLWSSKLQISDRILASFFKKTNGNVQFLHVLHFFQMGFRRF